MHKNRNRSASDQPHPFEHCSVSRQSCTERFATRKVRHCRHPCNYLLTRQILYPAWSRQNFRAHVLRVVQGCVTFGLASARRTSVVPRQFITCRMNNKPFISQHLSEATATGRDPAGQSSLSEVSHAGMGRCHPQRTPMLAHRRGVTLAGAMVLVFAQILAVSPDGAVASRILVHSSRDAAIAAGRQVTADLLGVAPQGTPEYLTGIRSPPPASQGASTPVDVGRLHLTWA